MFARRVAFCQSASPWLAELVGYFHPGRGCSDVARQIMRALRSSAVRFCCAVETHICIYLVCAGHDPPAAPKAEKKKKEKGPAAAAAPAAGGMSKSEMKRQKKAAEKAAAKAAKAAAAPPKPVAEAAEKEELDPTKYFANRYVMKAAVHYGFWTACFGRWFWESTST